jgi:acetyl esterase
MTAPLDPVIAQIIPLLPLRDPETMTPQSARDALRALAAARAAIPPPQVLSASDQRVKGAAGPLAARVYRVSHGKSPTVVFFHGGGWVAGDLETHDRQARLLAIEIGAVVVSVDYRRPPETRFPGAFEDALAALRDVIADIATFGGDTARIGVAGDSAGGNLAAAVAIACRDAGIGLAAQLLAYPATDVAGNYATPWRTRAFPRAQKTPKATSCRARSCNGSPAIILVTPGMAPTGGFRRCARKASSALRRRWSARRGSIRCATKARPMPTRWPPPASPPNIMMAPA